jgi:Transglutaminase-like superfamily
MGLHEARFRLSLWKAPPAALAPTQAPGAVRIISPHVRVADVDGLTLVMDLPTSAFYFLDDDASRLWRELRDAQGSVAAAKVALGRGDESSRRLEGMLDDFVASCEARGFLVRDHPLSVRGVRRAPRPRRAHGRSLLALRAWLWMLRTDVALRRREFGTIYQRLEQGAGARPGSVDSVDVHAARAAFMRAENFYVRRRAPNDCLPRSLALYGFMRGLGVPVVHRIGARRFPVFGCHAWVEHGGVPVMDRRADVSDYTLIASM